MSDSFTVIIPTVPEFVPSEDDARRAALFISEHYRSDQPIEPRVSAEIAFQDNGENLSAISCPRCGISVEKQWPAWMEAAAASGFADRRVRTDCCAFDTELNALDYQWPVGFSRFAIELMNPGGSITDQHMREIAILLKCPVRQILRYV